MVLLFGLLYHALNGLRLILQDFAPGLASRKIARMFFYIQMLVFLVVFIPAGFFMMYTLPLEQFGSNAALSLIITLGIIAVPGIIAGAFSLMPTAANTGLDSDSTSGNYQDGISRIVASRQRRVMNRGAQYLAFYADFRFSAHYSGAGSFFLDALFLWRREYGL